MSPLDEFQKIFPDFTWDYTPDSLKEQTQKHIQSFKNFIERLVLLEEDKLNFENFLKPFFYEQSYFQRKRNLIDLLTCVFPCEEICDAANECFKIFNDFTTELETRKDLYDILCKVRKVESQLSPEHDRYLNKLLLYGRRRGLHLHKDEQAKLETIFKEINKLCGKIKKNIEEKGFNVKLRLSELIDIEQNIFKFGIESKDSPFITLDNCDITHILNYCPIASSRQAVEKAFNSRFNDTTVAIVEKIIKLRQETVDEFLLSMTLNLQKSTKREMDCLLELKEKECERYSVDFDGKINPYDLYYYQRIVEEQEFFVNHDVLQEYFPLDHVKQHVMEIFQTLLNLSFTKLDGAMTWHPDVSLYSVCDSNESTLLGYFYLDLFQREHKNAQEASFCIETLNDTEIGRRVSCAVMVTNFTKPSLTKHCLLTHQEVKTFFHHFGHVMHYICSNVSLYFFQGPLIEEDFSEALSKMFENWAWEKECLKKISCHYKTNECLSDELIDKLTKSRKANISIYYSQQILISKFDHIIHTTPQVIKSVTIDLLGTHFAELFEIIANGDEALYYSYFWNEVLSIDMFISRFKREGIFNPSTGLTFRKCILEPGPTQDANDLFKKFLGRVPSQEPFLEHVGVLPSSQS